VNLTVLAGRNENIYEMSTAEVVQTAVSMHGRTDTIPTMTEYVERARELGIPLMIELKITGNETRDPVDELLAELDAIDGTEGNVFHSLDRAAVEKLKRLRPDLHVGLTIAINVGKLPDVGNDFYVVEQASLTPEMIDWSHARGLPIYAWTVNDRMAMDALLAAGIDGLVTDQLDEAVALLADPSG
jgi:glycerophosphoryl diester phosphodiesterase